MSRLSPITRGQIDEDWAMRTPSEKSADREVLSDLRSRAIYMQQVNDGLCCTKLRHRLSELLVEIHLLTTKYIDEGSL